MFEIIPREERNMKLKESLRENPVLVFPKDGKEAADGLP